MNARFQPRLATWPIDPVLRRLKATAPLAPSEEILIRGLCERRERRAPGYELIGEGQPARAPRFLLAGWAACQRVLPDGRRQLFRFILPGDSLGFAGSDATAPWSICALTALETVEAAAALEAAEEGDAPGLAAAFAIERARNERYLLDHMVRLGQQTAYERVAHLLLELQRRLHIAGLGDSQRFPLPLTQEMLADALGLSIVHVNRTLQQLRREGLLELRSGVAILLQPDVLRQIADYRAPVPTEKRPS